MSWKIIVDFKELVRFRLLYDDDEIIVIIIFLLVCWKNDLYHSENLIQDFLFLDLSRGF